MRHCIITASACVLRPNTDQVLPGKAYRCTKLIHGASLKAGYDSHTSPDDKELVIFNSAAILPAYIVYFKQSNADFKYTKVTTNTQPPTHNGLAL